MCDATIIHAHTHTQPTYRPMVVVQGMSCVYRLWYLVCVSCGIVCILQCMCRIVFRVAQPVFTISVYVHDWPSWSEV